MPQERYPYDACKRCPIAQGSLHLAKKHDIRSKEDPVLVGTSVACIVTHNIEGVGDSPYIAHTQALALFETEGYFLPNSSPDGVGEPPWFCPQVQPKKK